MSKVFNVYMHIAPNQKKYIGITSQKPNRRWHAGIGYRHNEYFYRAIKKYGWDNFQHILLYENVSKDEAEKIEIELIAKYKTNDRKYGYNIHSGGGTRLGNKMPKGEKSPRHKKVQQYDINGNFIKEYGGLRECGRELGLNYKTIEKCCNGECNSAFGYNWKYKNSNKKIVPIKLGHSHEPNAVLYHKVMNIETGEVFSSVKEACQKYNTKNVSRACQKNLTSGGYHWKYVDK